LAWPTSRRRSEMALSTSSRLYPRMAGVNSASSDAT
jgi:hypothetical protein